MVVLDTNIIIDNLRTAGRSPLLTKISDSLNSYDIFVSVLTVQELFAGDSAGDLETSIKIKKIFAEFTCVDYDYEKAELAGELVRKARKCGHALHVADAAIAATAISLNAQLATKNIKDFYRISGLALLDIENLQPLRLV